MGLPEMSNFLLGDSMDDVKSSDNLTHAQTIMQIFYFVVETLQKEATNQEKFPIQDRPGEFSSSWTVTWLSEYYLVIYKKSFGVQNAARERPLELRDKSLERRNQLEAIRPKIVTPKQYYKMIQTGAWNEAKRRSKQPIKIDWSYQ